MQGLWFIDSGTGLWKREAPATSADVAATPVEIDILSKPRALVLGTLLANVHRQDDSDERDTYASDNDDDDEAYDNETGAQFWQDLLATAVDENSYELSSREVNEDLRGLFGDIVVGVSRKMRDVAFDEPTPRCSR